MSNTVGRDYTYLEKDYEYNKDYVAMRISQLEKYFAVWKPKKVLELGSGNGQFAVGLKQVLDADVYGTEISDSGIKTSSAHGIKVKKADLNKEIPFDDNFFDLVISDQLVEHIIRTDVLFSESRRVLKKNGKLIVITPNLSFWLNRILFLFGEYPLFLEVSDKSKAYGTHFLNHFMKENESMGHVRVFNLPALTDMITASGFTIEYTFGMPLSWNLPPVVKSVYDLVDRTAGHKASLARDIGVIAVKK